LKAIQALEKETGKIIMAYPTPPVASNLSDEQLDKIRKLEKKLCVRLVAYETH
jgi:alanine-alpha-ketoisovalerate/valine-pyruvate aminotransferase